MPHRPQEDSVRRFRRDPLLDCVMAGPSNVQGTLELRAVPSTEAMLDLVQHPGVSYLSKAWRIPVSLFNTYASERWPLRLNEYGMDSARVLRGGMQLDGYQRCAVRFLRSIIPMREGAILALDAGGGKTCCALQAMDLDGFFDKPCVVLGPKKALSIWCGPGSDAVKQFKLHIEPLSGREPDEGILRRHKWVFCHYEIIEAWQALLVRVLQPAGLIFDEIHVLSNPQANWSDAAYSLSLCHTVQRRIGLTGTPIVSSRGRADLWPQLRIVQPRQWGGWSTEFDVRYCGARRVEEHGGGHMELGADTNTEELTDRLRGTLVRYTIADAGACMPELVRHDVQVDVEASELQACAYAVAAERAERATSGAERLVATTDALTALNWVKMNHALAQVIAALAEHERVVLFFTRQAPAAKAHEILSGMAKPDLSVCRRGKLSVFGPVTGAMRDKVERDAIAEEFSRTPNAVFVGSLGAAGMCINDLQTASGLVFGGLWWNTADLIQAERRLLRRGNPHKKIDVWFLRVKGSLDDRVLQVLHQKAAAAQGVSDNDTEGLALAQALGICSQREDDVDKIFSSMKEIAHAAGI